MFNRSWNLLKMYIAAFVIGALAIAVSVWALWTKDYWSLLLVPVLVYPLINLVGWIRWLEQIRRNKVAQF